MSDDSGDVDNLSLWGFLKKKTLYNLRSLLNIKGYIEFPKNTSLYDNSSVMIKNLIDFNDCTVKEIMVVRNEIDAVDINISKNELLSKVTEFRHTRIPIYENNIDNIIGFIHVKDMLSIIHENCHLKEKIRNIIYIPLSMRALNLFMKMKATHIYIAIVLDEYGGTEGLVTMANIIEKIVGNVEDELDDSSLVFDFVRKSDNKIEVNARMSVRSLESLIKIKLRDEDENEEDYSTVGGLILSMIGRVPGINEEFVHKNGIKFTIKEADERCIRRIIVDLSNYMDNLIDNQ